jgi:hypothetical protein
MTIRLSVAAAAVLLCGGSALAQSNATDMRQDAAQVHGDGSQVSADNAAAARAGRQIRALRSRAKHETGAKHDADLAEANRLEQQAKADYGRARIAEAQKTAAAKDLHHDQAQPPR